LSTDGDRSLAVARSLAFIYQPNSLETEVDRSLPSVAPLL
jgi:hypothetical protein